MAKAQSAETKLADQISNTVEDVFFNPSLVGRQLIDNPLYTIDRIMEIIAYTIYSAKGRYNSELEAGQTSEGLILAINLSNAIDKIKSQIQFNSLRLPK